MQSQQMDRGEKLKCLETCSKMEIRQTRRAWFTECCCCENESEFRFYAGGDLMALSLEDSDFCCRFWCKPNHDFHMEVMNIQEAGKPREIITVDRPFRMGVSSCKCCCKQISTITSGGDRLGHVTEESWFCVPSFLVMNQDNEILYKVHPPTCVGGTCIDCCYDGNNCCCGRGCCYTPFHVFPASSLVTSGGVRPAGRIVKLPESVFQEVFSDSDAFNIEFPEDATREEKAVLLGTGLFINALFFEGEAKECGSKKVKKAEETET